MSLLRAVGAAALADLRERTRRQSFLAAVVAVGWLAYLVASGRLSLRLDTYQGAMNAPWLGSVVALVVCTFLGWLGFFLINSAVELDRRTGVGEVLAACPISRLQYALAKWLASFAVLGLLVGVLMIASLLLHWRNLSQITADLPALLAPIVIIAVPMMALAAACGVLLESVRPLRGGRGNAVWLLGFWVLVLWSEHVAGGRFAGLGLSGVQLLYPSMAAAAKAAYPAYHGGFVLGFAPHRELQLFHWEGVDWTMAIVLQRAPWLVVATLLVLLASACFDRFDPAAAAPGRQRAGVGEAGDEPGPKPVYRTDLKPAAPVRRFSPGYRLLSELRWLLAGAGRGWWAGALGLLLAGLIFSAPPVRGMLLLASWVWPVTIWSQMGCREMRAGMDETVFSCPHPLLLQLPAQWLAGFLLALLTGAGVLLRLLIGGETGPLLAALTGAAFIPCLALALGVLSGTSKVFEVLYLLLCYAGPLEGIAGLDFMGAHAPGGSGVWLAVAAVSLCLAFLWRFRQMHR
jgi:hypothetical protein